MVAGDSRPEDLLWRAIARERTKLANALHDGALQSLMVAQQEVTEAREEHGLALAELSASVQQAMNELRALTGALHEETLQELPLGQAIGQIAHALSLRGGVAITLHIAPAADGYRDSFLREAVRELLTNVVQHARASTAAVALTVEDEELLIEITDDGTGFDPKAARAARTAGHLGLQRLERIAAKSGGSFAMTSQEPRGTRATLQLPVVTLNHREDISSAPDPAPVTPDAQDVEHAAETRDAIAHSRDLTAIERDRKADARDVETATEFARLDHEATAREPDAGERVRAGDRRASADERQAAASRDRHSSAEDRQVNARGRLYASADRKALTDQIAVTESDALTGAWTRAAGQRELDHDVERSHRTGLPLVVAYVDASGGNRRSDRTEPAANDMLLKRVVAMLRHHLRSYDLIARVGGDEFFCALSETSLDAARARFDAIEAALATAPEAALITVGLAALAPQEGAAQVLARADAQRADRRRARSAPSQT